MLYKQINKEHQETKETLSERKKILEYEAKRLDAFKKWNAFVAAINVINSSLQKVNPGTAGSAAANFVADRVFEIGGNPDLKANMSKLKNSLNRTSPAQEKLAKALSATPKQIADRMRLEGFLKTEEEYQRAVQGEHKGIVTAGNRYVQEAIKEAINEINDLQQTMPEAFDTAERELEKAYEKTGEQIESMNQEIEKLEKELEDTEFSEEAWKQEQDRTSESDKIADQQWEDFIKDYLSLSDEEKARQRALMTEEQLQELDRRLGADQKPQCGPNERMDNQGNCVPICKPNEKLDADGNCVAVCKDGEKLNEKGECVPAEPGGDALQKARTWLDKARKKAGIVSESLKAVESIKAELAEMLTANQADLTQSLAPPADAAELMAACSEAQAKTQALQNEIKSAKTVSDGHLSILKQSYAEVASARKKACQQADQASASQDPEECKRPASRAAAHAAAARQAARNAQAAADKMKSVYARIQSQNEMASLNQMLGKIPAAIENLNDQIARAESLLADLNPANFDEKRQQGLSAAARADEAAQQVPDIVAIIHGLLMDIDPALSQQAKEIRNQADAVKEIVASQTQSAAQAAEEISAGGERAGLIAVEATAKIDDLAAMRQSLASCRDIDLGANLNDLRTNRDLGEIFGPAAVADAETATLCAGGADAICQDLQSAGCQSDAQCDPGYVCENRKCVSPFDSGYDDYTDTMDQRDSDRAQDRADQVAADQSGQGGRSGFTSGDMDQDIASAQDAVAGKCSKDSQCPAGYVCRGGQCVEKAYECAKDSDCDPGYECRHGECVKKSGCSSDADCTGGQICKDGKCADPAPAQTQQAALAVSPANKAVVLKDTVNLRAVYTDTDGSTKDVTSEAEWNPSSSFSSGEIGVYPITATYNGLVAGSQITVVQEKGMDDITVNKKVITVTFWDSGRLEDGDMIDVLINGKVVFPGITLTFAKQSRTITMNADVIVVGFKALNEGSSPPNTASVTFSEVTAGKETQKYSLKEHQSANMNVTYKP
ncbi:MAG: hypothetical protein U5L07_08720 [Desulfobacterales bacterium]|nr:hypothetical protein [Desulfobacterales bacterium]